MNTRVRHYVPGIQMNTNTEPPTPNPRSLRTGTILALLILVAVPYVTALTHGFVYDDHGSIAENPFLQDNSNIAQAITLRTITDPTVPDGRRPAVVLSYFTDRMIWGVKPFGYHVTNLLLHLLSVFLLLQLLRRLDLAPPFFAIAAALAFGLHPVLTEAVQVPAFREDLLVSVFGLLYLLAAASREKLRRLAIPALVLALASKESAVCLPFLAALMWVCFPALLSNRKARSALLGMSAVVMIVFIVLWSLGGSFQAASREWAGLGLAFPANLFTAPWLWISALRVLLVPYPLVADYVIDPVSSLLSLRFAVGTAAVALWIWLVIRLRHKRPRLAFGMGWMLLAFLPVANLVPLYNPFAERYLYFVTAGYATVLAWALAAIPPARARSALLGLICAVYAVFSFARLAYWIDDYTLWSKTLEQQPASARAHTWLGLELKKQGRFEEAFQYFVKADQLNPNDVSALVNIAILYGQNEMLNQAEAALREAIRRRPNKADAHWNLAVCLQLQGRREEARAQIEKTLELEPRHVMANRATAEMKAADSESP